MMPEQLPECLLCKKKNYAPGGGSFSPTLQQQGFTCNECKAHVELVGMDACALLMFNATDAHFEYVNRVVFSVWREWCARVEAARAAIRGEHVREVNAEMGISPDTTGHTLIEDKGKYREWCNRLDVHEERDRSFLYMPVGFEQPTMLPQMPLDMRALVLRHSKWIPCPPERTQKLVIPPDPIRVVHDRGFAELFDRVREGTGVLCEVEEIPNEYYDDKYKREPWYRFGVGDGTVIVGPRKRVIAIRGAREREIPVSSLRDIAKADGVTWYNGDSWQGTSDTATSCEIHAYGRDKAVEYLTLLIQALTA